MLVHFVAEVSYVLLRVLLADLTPSPGGNRAELGCYQTIFQDGVVLPLTSGAGRSCVTSSLLQN